MIDQQVSRHARHPSCKPAVRRSIAPQRPVDPQKNVLREVFRLRAIPREPIANVEDAARMAAHKLFPGRTVALEALLDQLGILLQRLISPSASNPGTLTCATTLGQFFVKPWAAISACHTMERKVPPKCSPRHPTPQRKNARILLIRREKHNECPVWVGISFRLGRLHVH